MKVAVLVSGGVDSSVALALLKQQGYDVTAFYLKIWLEDELAYLGNCPWQEDLDYVQKTCEQLQVPLEVLSLQHEYHDKVVSYAIAEITSGRTPNPDMYCNKHIKFGMFWDAVGNRFDRVATGHYAQVSHEKGIATLVQSPDIIKDQTYFLARLSQEQLQKTFFPIGHLQKAQVRELAHSFNLPTKNRKDSQGICFLGKLKFPDFVAHYLGTKQGDLIEEETGTVVGTHNGAWFYTIGQRQGIGLSGGPWYVVHKDMSNNRVYISRNYYSEDKIRDAFIVQSLNWFGKEIPDALQVKLRHGPQKYNCVISKKDTDSIQVKLAERDQGIASGQFAVFYSGNICIGSGIIA